MSDTLVRVDPRFAPEHAAYYLGGLLEHTGVPPLPFTREGFPARYRDNKPLAFTLRRGDSERNIFIAADDMPDIDETALGWADVYGKVNLVRDLVPSHAGDKVVPIGPSHAVKLWGVRDSLQVAARTARAGGKLTSTKEHYRRFWLQTHRRVDASHYEPDPAEDRYVFYNSWLWSKHAEANPPRARFIRACRALSPTVEFEGGFIARRRNDVPEFEDLVADRDYPLPEYLVNIKRSTVVFNNPAAHHCLGWKLAEFLRLGKAIVSLPLSRELPAPLVHGEHLHIVDDDVASMQEAVRTIVGDPEYRHRLEDAARHYYLEYLEPRRVIERLATIAFGRPTVTNQPTRSR
jgi:glycosyltransferase involved in cell wall biosynthesis